ncbi:BrnT family toxin [Aurantimonas sp. A3-2-R12]|uniref:BrnT family toxin n=1 Tax=Aurantimonas sp. A3-2-R12 TaxID=3114362 RepID=UPI002E196053|nr:BrnT family toxin [Aurantimonas sp. A3-2-R12]
MTEPFDPKKDRRNRTERGLSLKLGFDIIAGRVIEFEDTRFEYGERRIVCFGRIDGRLYVCVYTVREEGPRIISVRKANQRERARFG